jgi:predicted dehydrogenase
VVDAARAADRLLAVDLSYRFTAGMAEIRPLLQGGELGRLYACDLVFHNAYGPDKPWFYDPVLSGGGCVMDLGVHLVDLALWALDFPEVTGVTSKLFAGGEPLAGRTDRVEDYAVATLELATGAVVQLACSWSLHAGQEAVIEASFYGSEGGVFAAQHRRLLLRFRGAPARGTTAETLAAPADAWGGRAAEDWAAARGG